MMNRRKFLQQTGLSIISGLLVGKQVVANNAKGVYKIPRLMTEGRITVANFDNNYSKGSYCYAHDFGTNFYYFDDIHNTNNITAGKYDIYNLRHSLLSNLENDKESIFLIDNAKRIHVVPLKYDNEDAVKTAVDKIGRFGVEIIVVKSNNKYGIICFPIDVKYNIENKKWIIA